MFSNILKHLPTKYLITYFYESKSLFLLQRYDEKRILAPFFCIFHAK